LIDRFVGRQSVRRTIGVLGIRRQTYYARKRGHRVEQEHQVEQNDKLIAHQLREAIKEHLSWGFWMIFYFLKRQADFKWNHKKVYRIWRLNGFHLIKKPKKPVIKRLYHALLSPKMVNQGWAMDFLSEWIINDGQSIRIINIMDECSRRALWTQAKASITAKMLVDILDKLIQVRGKPAYIRCDNGPEFIAQVLADWAKDNGIELKHIQPGKPTQNGLIERLNGTLRTECLNLEWFKSLEQVNECLQDWWQVYNFHRPHSSVGYLTPDEFEQLNKKLYFYPVAA
jgi:putative transposase